MENLSRVEYYGEYYFLVSKSFIDRIAKELDGERKNETDL